MSYNGWRTLAIRNMAELTISEFLNGYRPGRPTVLLLPGGMGSQLDRSLDAYGRGKKPPTLYDTVWVDIGTLFGQALTLGIEDNGRDRGGHVIIANGPLRCLVNAYDETERFFADSEVNYLVFGYDWRRPLDESAALLQAFLEQLRDRVCDKHNEDMLPNLTLLAHSQGGLVAKIFLHRRPDDISSRMKQLITVATPFYGTWSHQRRYFIGEPMLKDIYSGRDMAKIVASLPGPYGLMFLSKREFNAYKDALNLARYPVRNPDDSEGPDPYDMNSLNRYPKWIKEHEKHEQHLHDAANILCTVAAPLQPSVAERVYNIRSVADEKTPVELKWCPLPDNFDPDKDKSPIQIMTRGLGDGTVPGWSAWHASVPKENKVNLKQSYDHIFLAEDPQVLEIVQMLVNNQSLNADKIALPEAARSAGEATPKAATPKEVETLFQDIADNKIERNDPRLGNSKMWRGIYRELTR